MTFPMARPVPVTPEVSAQFRSALEERGIQFEGEQRVASLNVSERTAQLESGASIAYDMFIGVPVHRVPEVVASSGLADGGWVQIDQSNLRTPFAGVYALGDVAGGPRVVAKAGIFAEGAARVVAADIAAEITGSEPPPRWEGTGNCYAEFGDGIVGKVEVNFLGGDKPMARLLTPSRELAAEKKAFGRDRRARWFGS
jgi:sulfide:quinone oxidoreductase